MTVEESTRPVIIGAVEAGRILKLNRNSVTRLVKEDKLTPAGRGEGLKGPMFFYKADVEALAARRHAELVERLTAAGPQTPRSGREQVAS